MEKHLFGSFKNQERFYLLSARNTTDFPLWWIPLTYTSNYNATFAAWMMGTEDGIELELPSSAKEWIIFNVDQIGLLPFNVVILFHSSTIFLN